LTEENIVPNVSKEKEIDRKNSPLVSSQNLTQSLSSTKNFLKTGIS